MKSQCSYNYPSREELLKESAGVRITEFSHSEIFGDLEGFDNGFCAGLSYTHITQQLHSSFNPLSNTPSLREEIFKESVRIQNKCRSEECLTIALQDNLGIKKERTSFRAYRPFFVPTILKNKIKKSSSDEKSRAVLIGFYAKRFPSGAPASGGHVISMTIEPTNDGLYCTAFDSNTFFAIGKGEKGCQALADKMYEAVRAYDSGTAYTYSLSTKTE